jgi:hypothetical protein
MEEGQPRPSTSDISSAGERGAGERMQGGEDPSRPAEQGPQPSVDRTSQAPAGPTPLFTTDDANKLRRNWDNIQAGFVDDPRRAVQDADALVAEVMKRLADTFAGEKSNLEGQWGRGRDVSTEDLRLALQRYRSFFDRLLSF